MKVEVQITGYIDIETNSSSSDEISDLVQLHLEKQGCQFDANVKFEDGFERNLTIMLHGIG